MDKSRLQIMEWNQNGRSRVYTPPNFIGDYVEGDIIVFNETRAEALMDLISDLGYDCIASDDLGTNQVLVAAKKQYQLRKIAGSLDKPAGDIVPDFLHGMVTVAGKEISILGVRIKAYNFKNKYYQVQDIWEYLDKIQGSVICSGDFNSGQIRGLADAPYSEVRSLYGKTRKDEPSNLRFYNFHKLRELLGERLILNEPLGEENSWGLTERDGVLLYGRGARLKNDLILHSSDIRGIQTRLSWAHVRDHAQLYLDMLQNNQGPFRIERGWPDHARLLATVEV